MRAHAIAHANDRLAHYRIASVDQLSVSLVSVVRSFDRSSVCRCEMFLTNTVESIICCSGRSAQFNVGAETRLARRSIGTNARSVPEALLN